MLLAVKTDENSSSLLSYARLLYTSSSFRHRDRIFIHATNEHRRIRAHKPLIPYGALQGRRFFRLTISYDLYTAYIGISTILSAARWARAARRDGGDAQKSNQPARYRREPPSRDSIWDAVTARAWRVVQMGVWYGGVKRIAFSRLGFMRRIRRRLALCRCPFFRHRRVSPPAFHRARPDRMLPRVYYDVKHLARDDV